jgi:hypothetical protein
MTLAPELEARVQVVADQRSLRLETALSELLEAALAPEEQEFQEIVAALRASLAGFPAMRAVSMEEWREDSQAWITAQIDARVTVSASGWEVA